MSMENDKNILNFSAEGDELTNTVYNSVAYNAVKGDDCTSTVNAVVVNGVEIGDDVEYSEEQEIKEEYAERKKRSALLSSVYARLDGWKLLPKQSKMLEERGFYTRCRGFAERAESVRSCGSSLWFKHSIDVQTGIVSKDGTLHRANFCRDRLCPMCNWRRAKKCYNHIRRAMRAKLADGQTLEKSFSWVFLTLTVPNVSGEELRETIDRMQKAFFKFMHYKCLQIVRGYYKALEITVNSVNRSFHPHFHILLAMPKSYFARNRSKLDKGYIEHSDFLALWQRAMKDNSITQVSVQRVYDKKPSDGKKTFGVYDALKEIAKYTLKDVDIVVRPHSGYTNKKTGLYVPEVTEEQAEQMTEENVFYLASSLEGVRLIAFGGIIKDVIKRLSADGSDNLEDGDLLNVGDDVPNTAQVFLLRHYVWVDGVYMISDVFIDDGNGLLQRLQC